MDKTERIVKEWVVSVANKTLEYSDVERLISQLSNREVIASDVLSVDKDGELWIGDYFIGELHKIVGKKISIEVIDNE